MKKSVKVRVICLVVASAMLSFAVAAAAVMGSPYETLKRALLDALTTRNVTEVTNMTLTVDGAQVQTSRSRSIIGDDASLNYLFDADGNEIGYYYRSAGLAIDNIGYSMGEGVGNDEDWYSADVYPADEFYRSRSGGITMFSADERGSARMRFLELLADALIGDLKNNVTMTSENGVRYISGTLTESQVPEIAKAGIDVIIEQSGRYYGSSNDISFDGNEYVYEHINLDRDKKSVTTWKQHVRAMTAEELEAWEDGTFYDVVDGDYWGTTYIGGINYISLGHPELVGEYVTTATRSDYMYNNNPLDLPMQSLVINYIHGEAQVDADGNLLQIEVSATATVTDIFGDVSVFDLKADARYSDIGTSSSACPIPGAERILTVDHMKERFGMERVHVYFTLNDDGGINVDSITTNHPGEKTR